MQTAVAGTPDADEFAEWVRPALVAMTRLARRLAPQHEPDDIVQDALVRAWTKWHLYDPERGTPTTWLLAITADRARDARRTRLRHLRVVDDTAEPPDVPAPAPDAEADLDLDRAIEALPERQQLAVTLHYFIGLTVAETASVMDVTAGTVKSTLFDARTNLRRALEIALGDDDD
jgi:RNA polymerase sigma-70 factor (ECF subfamily)